MQVVLLIWLDTKNYGLYLIDNPTPTLIITVKSNDVSQKDGFALVSGKFTFEFGDKAGCDVALPVNVGVSDCSELAGASGLFGWLGTIGSIGFKTFVKL